jgi:tRNA G18 (ribose-2'-O)-methylase SpoU
VKDGALIPLFGAARRDPALAVLEGFHPLKHALRFGADVREVLTRDREELLRLSRELGPDVADAIEALAREVDPELFARLSPLPISTGVIALAVRPTVEARSLLAGKAPDTAGPVVLLEDPRDLGNLGACVRVAAAADAAAVLSTGSHDPWHPDALRGAAGLHFALPVARLAALDELDGCSRPLLALDPAGEPLDPASLEPSAVLAFGSERRGLSEELGARATARVSIPMRTGVSSLNLATSVAAVLFTWRMRAVAPRQSAASQQPAARASG